MKKFFLVILYGVSIFDVECKTYNLQKEFDARDIMLVKCSTEKYRVYTGFAIVGYGAFALEVETTPRGSAFRFMDWNYLSYTMFRGVNCKFEKIRSVTKKDHRRFKRFYGVREFKQWVK